MARRRIITLSIIGAVLALPAWYVAPTWGLVTHGATLAVGALAGWLVARTRRGAMEESLRARWRDWNRLSIAGGSLGELHRRVKGRRGDNRAFVLAAVLTAVWALELLVFTLALMDTTSLWWSHVAISINALIIMVLLMDAVHLFRWSRALASSIRSMVREGEIGVWGVA